MKSIIQNSKECYVCGCNQTEEHHVFYGPNRKLSEKHGLKVRLCINHHRGNDGVHGGNRELDLELKKNAQKLFEQKYSHEMFMTVFGKNYL